MNLQYFAADTGGGAGGTGDPAPSDNPGGQEPPAPKGNTGEPKDDKPEDKTFTQEDVNNIAAKEARKAQEKLFKELGIEDFENAKDGFKKFQEWQEAQKTDAEKQAEKLQNLEKESLQDKETISSLTAQVSAMKAGVNAEFVEDVVALAQLQVTEDVTIDDAIKKVTEKYPHFLGEGSEEPGKPSISTGNHSRKSGGDSFADVLLGK
jgi:hypothetical protein